MVLKSQSPGESHVFKSSDHHHFLPTFSLFTPTIRDSSRKDARGVTAAPYLEA